MKRVIFSFAIAALLMTGCGKDEVYNDLYVIDFEAPSVLPFVAISNDGSGVFDGGFVDAGSGIKLPASATYTAEWDFW